MYVEPYVLISAYTLALGCLMFAFCSIQECCISSMQHFSAAIIPYLRTAPVKYW